MNLIVRALRVNVLLDGDFAFRQGEVGDKMYFIKTGYIQIGTADKSLVFVSKGPGAYVGELTMFNEGQRRSASAWSLCDCVLFTLSISGFKEVLALYDADGTLYEQMRHITEAEAQKQKQINTMRKCSVAGGSGAAPTSLPPPSSLPPPASSTSGTDPSSHVAPLHAAPRGSMTSQEAANAAARAYEAQKANRNPINWLTQRLAGSGTRV